MKVALNIAVVLFIAASIGLSNYMILNTVDEAINEARAETINLVTDLDIKNRNQDMTITHLRLNLAVVEIESEVKQGTITMRDLSSLDDDVVDELEKRLKKAGLKVRRDGKVLAVTN
jgi:hypothetical protein